MSKMLGMVNTLEIDSTLSYLDGYIFGLKNYAVNFLNTYTLDELKNVYQKLKENNKEMYVVINKNLHNEEMNELKTILKQIEEMNIDGIFYADNGFITLKKEMNLKTNLIWYQEHLGTSYTSINTYYDLGIYSAVISNDITFHEVKEIISNAKSKLYYLVFGYLPMFVSERHQVKNYERYFNLEGSTDYNYFICEDKKYPIIDNELGTFAFSEYPVCAYDEYLEIKNDIPYVILSDLLIEPDVYQKIVQGFKEEQDVTNIIKTSSNFLYKDTIYKIK